MKVKKDANIHITCSNNNKEYINSKAKELNLTVSTFLINAANSYGLINPMKSPIKLRQICELAVYLKNLEMELPTSEEKFDEILRRCEAICLH